MIFSIKFPPLSKKTYFVDETSIDNFLPETPNVPCPMLKKEEQKFSASNNIYLNLRATIFENPMKEKISKFTLLLHAAMINPPSANTGETIDTKKHLWTVFNLKTPEKEKHRKLQNFFMCNSENSQIFYT